MLECTLCNKISEDTTNWHGIAHTDILMCDLCWNTDQPERTNPEDVYVPLNEYEGNENQWKKCWLNVCDVPNSEYK